MYGASSMVQACKTAIPAELTYDLIEVQIIKKFVRSKRFCQNFQLEIRH